MLPMTMGPAMPESSPEVVAQAGMMGDTSMLVFIGLSVVGLVLFGMPGRRR